MVEVGVPFVLQVAEQDGGGEEGEAGFEQAEVADDVGPRRPLHESVNPPRFAPSTSVDDGEKEEDKCSQADAVKKTPS